MANYLTTDTELTATANAIRSKAGTTGNIQYKTNTGFADAVNAIPTGGSTVVAKSAFTKITNKTSMQDTNSVITIPSAGTWKISWCTMSQNTNSGNKSQLYKNTSTAVGSSHQSVIYSGTMTPFSETLTLAANDTIMVKAQTQSGSSRYICVFDIIAEKQ